MASLEEQMTKDFQEYGYDKKFVKYTAGNLYSIQTLRLQLGSLYLKHLLTFLRSLKLLSETKPTSSKQTSSKESSKK